MALQRRNVEARYAKAHNDRPCPPQHLKLGPQSSQYAEIAAIIISVQTASSHNIRELLICTDSQTTPDLASHAIFQTGKLNGFKTANNKLVQHLFQAYDYITSEHDMIIHWKKVKEHWKQPGPDKDLNDRTYALAK